MLLLTIVAGAYKPTYNWGASHCMFISHCLSKYCNKMAGFAQLLGWFDPRQQDKGKRKGGGEDRYPMLFNTLKGYPGYIYLGKL